MSLRAVAAAQSAYFTLGGLWPLLSMRTFLAVTGRKRELWLVRTVAGLLVVNGAVLGLRARRDAVDAETALLGAGSAAVLGGIDAWYGLRGRVPRAYLLDGAGEAALLAGWALAARRVSR